MMARSNWTQQTFSNVKNQVCFEYFEVTWLLWFKFNSTGRMIPFVIEGFEYFSHLLYHQSEFWGFQNYLFSISFIAFINLSTGNAKYIKEIISVPQELSFYRTHNTLYRKAVSGSLRSQKYWFYIRNTKYWHFLNK